MKLSLPALMLTTTILTYTGCSTSQEVKPTASTTQQELILTDAHMKEILKLDNPRQKITALQMNQIAEESSLLLVNKVYSFSFTRSTATNLKFKAQKDHHGKNRVLVIDRENRLIYSINDHSEKAASGDLILYAVADSL